VNEDRIGELLAELPPTPRAWILAAQQLPHVQREIERLGRLAEADDAVRTWLLAEGPRALREAGLEPAPRVVAALRARLGAC
jgi:hypothetical protein